jgi:hypothetical protein
MPRHEDFRYEIKDDMLYWAELEGIVSFGYYNFKKDENMHGCCGDEWEITLKDGTKRMVRGGWSSRSSALNAAGFPHSFDCAVNGVAYSLLVPLVKKILAPTEYELVRNIHDDPDYTILKKDRFCHFYIDKGDWGMCTIGNECYKEGCTKKRPPSKNTEVCCGKLMEIINIGWDPAAEHAGVAYLQCAKCGRESWTMEVFQEMGFFMYHNIYGGCL